jgi:hypothetical protein
MFPPELSDRNRLAYRAAGRSSGASPPTAIDGCCPTSTEPLAARCSGVAARVTSAVPARLKGTERTVGTIVLAGDVVHAQSTTTLDYRVDFPDGS